MLQQLSASRLVAADGVEQHGVAVAAAVLPQLLPLLHTLHLLLKGTTAR
jgi:hypothetical protein